MEKVIPRTKDFPALSGITTNLAGDFGYGDHYSEAMGREFRASRVLSRSLSGDFNYHKLIPDHGDEIIVANSAGAYAHGDGLVHFDEKGVSPEVLFSLTADCPTVVFASDDQRVIAIAHSGWRSAAKNIIAKMIRKIREEFGILPKDLYAGIFPGICGKCYEIKEDVGRLFPNFYDGKTLDLYRVALSQICGGKIPQAKISLARYCSFETKKGETPAFASARRDKSGFRNAVFITRRQKNSPSR